MLEVGGQRDGPIHRRGGLASRELRQAPAEAGHALSRRRPQRCRTTDRDLGQADHGPVQRLGVGLLEAVEDLDGLRLAELLGHHPANRVPGEELVLQAEVAEQGVGEILALLGRGLDRRGHASDGDSEDVGDAVEAADGVGEQTSALVALLCALAELPLDLVRAGLEATGLGAQLLGLGEAKQRVQLLHQEGVRRHPWKVPRRSLADTRLDPLAAKNPRPGDARTVSNGGDR